MTTKWRQLRTKKSGYATVHLQRDGKRFLGYSHRLVLEAFVGPCPPGMECCHEDGDHQNNCLSNLRWDTRKNNHADKIRHGRTAKGEKNPQAILTKDDALAIRSRLAKGDKAAEIAKDYATVNVATIFAIKRGDIWGWLGEEDGLNGLWSGVKAVRKNTRLV